MDKYEYQRKLSEIKENTRRLGDLLEKRRNRWFRAKLIVVGIVLTLIPPPLVFVILRYVANLTDPLLLGFLITMVGVMSSVGVCAAWFTNIDDIASFIRNIQSERDEVQKLKAAILAAENDRVLLERLVSDADFAKAWEENLAKG